MQQAGSELTQEVLRQNQYIHRLYIYIRVYHSGWSKKYVDCKCENKSKSSEEKVTIVKNIPHYISVNSNSL